MTMRFIALCMLISISIGTFAQSQGSLSPREQRKLLREERKRQEAEDAAIYLIQLEQMLKGARFVLEADMIFNKYGQSTPVQSSLNFILADSLYGVVQVGNPYFLGQNGVGGVTVDGHIMDYTYRKNDKRNTYYVKYSLRSSLGAYDIQLNILPEGRADATVSSNFSGNIRYSGRLVHPAESRVYQGSSY